MIDSVILKELIKWRGESGRGTIDHCSSIVRRFIYPMETAVEQPEILHIEFFEGDTE